jgi:hypothetical protein
MMARRRNREEVSVNGTPMQLNSLACNSNLKQMRLHGGTAVCAPDNSVSRPAPTGTAQVGRHDKEIKQENRTQHSLLATQAVMTRESLVICRLKRILVLVLLCFASAVATLTYVVLKGKQHQNYIDAVSTKHLHSNSLWSFRSQNFSFSTID